MPKAAVANAPVASAHVANAPVASAHVPTAMQTGTTLGFRDYFSLSKTKLPTGLQVRGGGNRTQKGKKKRRNGSPRRKTIKRTRKVR